MCISGNVNCQRPTGPTEASPPPHLPLLASNRQSIGKNKLWHVYSCIMLIKRHPMVAYSIYIRPGPKPTRQLSSDLLAYTGQRERERESSQRGPQDLALKFPRLAPTTTTTRVGRVYFDIQVNRSVLVIN